MNYPFNSSLVVLNLASNRLSNVVIPCSLPNLRLLDVSHNSVTHIVHLNRCPALQEAYFSHNWLASLHSFCPLRDLRVLDAGNNHLASLEAVAGLAANPKLLALQLLHNPICTRTGYEVHLKRLLPCLQHLNPVQIAVFSGYSRCLSSVPAVPQLQASSLPRNWGRLSSVCSPQHFHTLVGSAALSTDRSYHNLTTRLTPQSSVGGFWSAGHSARGSMDAKESSRKQRNSSAAKGKKRPDIVPRLLLAKVLATRI